MGQDATATLSEIEAARQRLQHHVDTLEDRVGRRLREQVQLTGRAVAAAGAGLLVVVSLAKRGRRRRTEHRRARVQAEALADVLEARRADKPARSRQRQAASPEEFASTVALLAALAALAATIVQAIARRGGR